MMSQDEIGYLVGGCSVDICVGNRICKVGKDEKTKKNGEEWISNGIKKLYDCEELSDSDGVYVMRRILELNETLCQLAIIRHLQEKGFSDMAILEITGISQEDYEKSQRWRKGFGYR